jgi:hypothetical protein
VPGELARGLNIEGVRVVAAGTTWEVTLAEKAKADQTLLIELDGRGTDQVSKGVEVQALSSGGDWRTVTWLHARAAAYPFVVEALQRDRVRLVFHQECAVRRLACMTPTKAEPLVPIAPSAVAHSRQAAAASALSAADETSLSLGKGERNVQAGSVLCTGPAAPTARSSPARPAPR